MISFTRCAIIVLALFLCYHIGGGQLNFKQNYYGILVRDVTVHFVNHEMVINEDINVKKLPSGEPCYNVLATFLEDIPETKILASAYYLSKNRKIIDMSVSQCPILKNGYFGLDIWKTTNGNFTDCPIKKGTYIVYNATVDATKFPPLIIPEGKYRLDLNFSVAETAVELYRMSFFADVYHKNKKKN